MLGRLTYTQLMNVGQPAFEHAVLDQVAPDSDMRLSSSICYEPTLQATNGGRAPRGWRLGSWWFADTTRNDIPPDPDATLDPGIVQRTLATSACIGADATGAADG